MNDGNNHQDVLDPNIESSLDHVIRGQINTKFALRPCRFEDAAVSQLKKYLSAYMEVLLEGSYKETKGKNPNATNPEVDPGFVEDAARKCFEPKINPPYDGWIKVGEIVANAAVGAFLGLIITILTRTIKTPTSTEFYLLLATVFIILVGFFLPKFLHRRSLRITAPR